MSKAAAHPSGAGRNANTVPQTTSCSESTETQIHALDLELEKSMRYHQRRGQFFDRMQNVTIIAVAVLGWVAFSETAGSAIIGSIGIVFAVPGALGLVLLLAHWAQAHELLLRRYEGAGLRIAQ